MFRMVLNPLRSPLLLAAIVAAGTLPAIAEAQQPAAAPPRPAAMVLTTTAWPDGDPIPLKYTQATPDATANPLGVSPPLNWTNVPPGTVSLVLLFHDPDVALNRGTDDQLHWLLWNIPGSATSLPEKMPSGAELGDGTRQVSASGETYRGPGAPATGPVHHYTLELFALDTMLDTRPLATWQETRAAVMRAVTGHVLGKAVYVGLFRRPAAP
jgi:Raf kinase inhibitor-like YbhB/YbcL family protein